MGNNLRYFFSADESCIHHYCISKSVDYRNKNVRDLLYIYCIIPDHNNSVSNLGLLRADRTDYYI